MGYKICLRICLQEHESLGPNGTKTSNHFWENILVNIPQAWL